MTNPKLQPRRKMLIEPKYQIVFAILMVLLQVNVVVLFQGLTQHRVRQVAAESGSLDAFLSTNLWSAMQGPMVFVAVGTSLALFLLGIWFSNRIVGPLPRLQQSFRAMAEGDYSVRLRFRPGDALEHVAADINRLAEALESRHGQAVEVPTAAAEPAEELELSLPVR